MLAWCRPIRRRAPRPSVKVTMSASSSLAEYRGRFSTTTPSWRLHASSAMAPGSALESFSELQSHYLFADRFGRPGKGNDKGKVEGLVGYARRNFMVPIPRAVSFAELNAHLLECCRRRL